MIAMILVWMLWINENHYLNTKKQKTGLKKPRLNIVLKLGDRFYTSPNFCFNSCTVFNSVWSSRFIFDSVSRARFL